MLFITKSGLVLQRTCCLACECIDDTMCSTVARMIHDRLVGSSLLRQRLPVSGVAAVAE